MKSEPGQRAECRRTRVGEIDDGEEDQSGRQGHSEEEEGLELLPGEPVLQVLQEGVGLQQRKHTCERGGRGRHATVSPGLGAVTQRGHMIIPSEAFCNVSVSRMYVLGGKKKEKKSMKNLFRLPTNPPG